jgi:endonuclease/exonuclease/phosphatase family metal-dependent hydrolase
VRTITTQQNGRYPSDHFPVVAEFHWPQHDRAH